jgi:hypothetical protein
VTGACRTRTSASNHVMTNWPREFHRQILDEVRVAPAVVVDHTRDADVSKEQSTVAPDGCGHDPDRSDWTGHPLK